MTEAKNVVQCHVRCNVPLESVLSHGGWLLFIGRFIPLTIRNRNFQIFHLARACFIHDKCLIFPFDAFDNAQFRVKFMNFLNTQFFTVSAYCHFCSSHLNTKNKNQMIYLTDLCVVFQSPIISRKYTEKTYSKLVLPLPKFSLIV